MNKPREEKIEKLPDINSLDIIYIQQAIISLAGKINEIIDYINSNKDSK